MTTAIVDKGLALEFLVEAEVPKYIYMDEGKLRQILMNLLSNAVKFTEEGGVEVRVRIHDRENEQSKQIGLCCYLRSKIQDQEFLSKIMRIYLNHLCNQQVADRHKKALVCDYLLAGNTLIWLAAN